MKNIFCRMLWEDPDKFDSKYPKDQRSIITFGLAISLVVMIEFKDVEELPRTFSVQLPVADAVE